ncbi:MAG: CheR family methyltransferase [Candidatus Xenobia bacterium]
MTEETLEALEIELLLEGVRRHYGYDFRDYSYASIRRRIVRRMEEEQLGTISALTDRLLHEPACMDRLLRGLTVHTTALFRDPTLYVALREKVFPLLRTYPFVRVWHAGCSTGEEVYSLAIALEEEGLRDRSRIYATDISEVVLRTARAGIYPLSVMQEYTENYIRAGGRCSFSEYYTADDDRAILRPALRDAILFSEHNLVTDASFNEFHMILCRNTMIYFKKPLQDRGHKLLYDSLGPLGLLVLGRSEGINYTPFQDAYDVLDEPERIYRRKC